MKRPGAGRRWWRSTPDPTRWHRSAPPSAPWWTPASWRPTARRPPKNSPTVSPADAAASTRAGTTETAAPATLNRPDDFKFGTVGKPLPGVDVKVAEDGELLVRGPNVFQGYWRMPEKTKAEFRPDGFFITGDLGTIGPDGYVSIVGRGKDLIITGGLNVYPIEVEERIDALPGVVESAVVGLPHPDFGEAVTAVVATGGGPAPTEAKVLKALEGELAAFKRPKRVIFVDELPRNTTGKVVKAALRARYLVPVAGPAPAVEPA